MLHNPVYQKETKASYRSVRTIVIMLLFNGSLAIVGLSLLGHIINNVNFNGSAEYSAMLQLYILTAALEFLLLMLIIPGNTAEAISGERERKTLETMLSTNITPFGIVLGKLEASLSSIFILIISSLPVLSLVFIYGGIQFMDLLILLSVLLLNAMYVGSAGIYASARFKRTTTSTVASYAFCLFVIGGTLALTQIPQLTNTAQFYLSSGTHSTIPWYYYLLLLNPGVTFYHVMNLQAGNVNALFELIDSNGLYQSDFIIEYWLYISLGVQFLFTLLFFFSAVHQVKIGPRSYRYKPQKKQNNRQQSNP